MGERARSERVMAEERRRRIEELLRRQAVASLADVVGQPEASEATARRDLVLLERLGLLARTRGGARAVQRHSTLEEEFEIRQSRDRREKRLIGQRAAELIEDNMMLFLTDGTTAYALAQCLVHRHLTVVTGALNIAPFCWLRLSLLRMAKAMQLRNVKIRIRWLKQIKLLLITDGKCN